MKLFFLLGTSLLILVGCSSESESSEPDIANSEMNEETTSEKDHYNNSLLNFSSVESGWINYDGKLGENTEYMITEAIDYNPELNYILNKRGYISYFNGEEFIRTVQQAPNELIEQINGANNIRVSFHNSYENVISLHEQ